MPKPSRHSSRDKDGPARSHIISLVGKNSFALQQFLSKQTAEFIEANGELGVERIDGEEADLVQLIEAVQGASLLSPKRLVIVRDLSLNKSAQANIEQIISSVDSQTNLIFVEPSVDRRSTYFKVLKDQTQLEDMREIEGPELTKWLVTEANDAGVELSLADANYLVEKAGQNQALLHGELIKLITHNPKISREDIDLLVVESPQSRVFDLLDTAFRGNNGHALVLYEEQRAQKIEPQEILSMIAWQLRLIGVMKLAAGKSIQEVSAEVAMSTFPLGKAGELAGRISNQRLKQLVNEAYHIDKLAKTKTIDLDEALKTYLATI